MQKPLTYESVLRLIRDLAKAAAKQRAEDRAAAAKQRAEDAKRLAEERAEDAKRIAALDQRLGDLGNSIGKELEDNVVDYLLDAKTFCGMPIDEVLPNLHKRDPHCQYDAAVANGSKVIVVEAKRHLTVKSVQRFIDHQLPLFPKAFPSTSKGKKIIGAMVFQRTHPGGKAIKMALTAGIHLYRATTPKTLTPIKTQSDYPH